MQRACGLLSPAIFYTVQTGEQTILTFPPPALEQSSYSQSIINIWDG